MSDPKTLTIFQVSLLAAIVADPGATGAELRARLEETFGLDLTASKVYDNLTKLERGGWLEKSAHRGAKGKAYQPTESGSELALERYGWLIDRVSAELT